MKPYEPQSSKLIAKLSNESSKKSLTLLRKSDAYLHESRTRKLEKYSEELKLLRKQLNNSLAIKEAEAYYDKIIKLQDKVKKLETESDEYYQRDKELVEELKKLESGKEDS